MQQKVNSAIEALETGYRSGKTGMLWTGGKESMVMLHLWREHISSKQPPLLVIDTSVHFEEVYEFREQISDEWDLDLDIRRNTEMIDDVLDNPADPRGFAGQYSEPTCPECGIGLEKPDGIERYDCPKCGFSHTPVDKYNHTIVDWGEESNGVIPKYDTCCGALKIDVIAEFISDGYKTLIVGRRSEDVGHDLPVYDEGYREPIPHNRIHPLASWSDTHVMAYIKKHGIPLPNLYSKGYEHTDCKMCVQQGEEGDDWSGASQEQKQQLQNLRDMGYM